MPNNDPRRDLIVNAVLSCVGTPFHHQGRRPGLGMDCGGLNVYGLAAAGIDTSRITSRYTRWPVGDRLLRIVREYGDEVDEWAPGNTVVFRRKDGMAAHLGVLVSEERFVHAWLEAKRVLISDVRQQPFRDSVHSLFRPKGFLPWQPSL